MKRQMRTEVWLCLLTFTLCWLALPARAQTVTGTLEGRVADQASAVVPGALVIMRNVETGQARTVKTNAEGFYRAPFLPLGQYTVTASANGFATTKQENVQVTLNQTLTAAAQALDGLGDRFGQSLVDGNEVLAEANVRFPEFRRDVQGLADTADVFANATPDLFDALENVVTTARTLNEQQGDLDQALMAAIGFGNVGADVIERGRPFLTRAVEDLIPTSELLDEYSPALFCLVRNFNEVAPKIEASLGGSNGYSLRTRSQILGAGNPYVYPDNVPRVNASGGPGGKPGCWAPITRDLWPAPYLVMDAGASIAPYNHFGLGQPIAIEYIWGRQIGENTINP